MDTSIMVIRKRCPADATILVYGPVDDMTGWVCPECGYFEPDLV